MRKLFLFLLPGVFLFISCWNINKTPELPPPQKVWGYKPVFTTDSSVLDIKAVGPQEVKMPGKIYVKGNLVFQNDLGQGIHVFDNSVPSSMQAIAFIRLLGNSEISIRGDMLYANSFADLVVIDLSGWPSIKEVHRTNQAFRQGYEAGPMPSQVFIPLPEHGVYYECPWQYSASTTQILTGWVRDSVFDNNCYYP